MKMVEVTLGESLVGWLRCLSSNAELIGWVKYWFPEFEFTWLGVSRIQRFRLTLINTTEGRDENKLTQRNGLHT